MPIHHFKRYYLIAIFVCIGISVAAGFVYWKTSSFTHQSTTIHFGFDDHFSDHADVFLNNESIESGAVSAPQLTDNTYYRFMSGGKAKIVFAPPFNISALRKLTTTFELQNPQGNLQLESAAGITLPLYIPGMEQMHKTQIHSSINHNDTFFVYTDKTIEAPSNAASIESWLKNQEKTATTITNDVTRLIDWDALESLPAIDTSPTTIQGTIYNDAQFTVAASKQLSLTFSKINFANSKKIDTNVIAEVQDHYGKIVAQKIFASDTIVNTKKLSTMQQIEWTTELPSEGLYTLHLRRAQSSAKVAFQNITLNTPYIALNTGVIQTEAPITAQVLTTDTPIQFSLLNTLDKTDLFFTGDDSFTYKANGNDLLVEHVYMPKIGTYSFTYTDTIQLLDGFFILGGAKTFQPYLLAHTTLNPKIIITGIDSTENKNTNRITVRNNWGHADLQKITALSTDNNTNFTLSEKSDLQPKLHKELLTDYQKIWSNCGITVFSRFSYPENAFNGSSCGQLSLTENLAKIIPNGSRITSFLTKTDTSDFYNSIDTSSVQNATFSSRSIPLSLRGNHEFALYTPNDLDFSLSLSNINNIPGNDTYTVSISDTQGNTLTTATIADDGNISDDGIASEPLTTTLTPPRTPSGIYHVRVYAQNTEQQDFMISELRANTSKIMALDHSWTYQPMTLYTDLNTLMPITFFASSSANKNAADDVLIDPDSPREERIEFNSENDRSNRSLLFSAGKHTIQTGKAQMQLSGTHFAFTPDGLFSYGPYSLGRDYVLLEDQQWGSTTLYKATFDYTNQP